MVDINSQLTLCSKIIKKLPNIFGVFLFTQGCFLWDNLVIAWKNKIFYQRVWIYFCNILFVAASCILCNFSKTWCKVTSVIHLWTKSFFSNCEKKIAGRFIRMFNFHFLTFLTLIKYGMFNNWRQPMRGKRFHERLASVRINTLPYLTAGEGVLNSILEQIWPKQDHLLSRI